MPAPAKPTRKAPGATGSERSASRRAGRPDAQTAEALDRMVLEAATRLFSKQGYAGTSIEQVAAAIGAGKTTIYRRYPGKADLFQAVLNTQVRSLLQSSSSAAKSSTDPLETLRQVCRNLLEMVLSPPATDLHHVLVAESRRFPSLVDHTLDHIVEPIYEVIRLLLRAARKAGQLRSECDIETTLRVVTGMTTGWATDQRLLGRAVLIHKEERSEFFRSAWGIFIQGVSPP